MTQNQRCKVRQYVGGGLGACARSGLVVSVDCAQRAAFERVVERALCGLDDAPNFKKRRPHIRKEHHYNVPKMGRKAYTMFMRMCQHREADNAIWGYVKRPKHCTCAYRQRFRSCAVYMYDLYRPQGPMMRTDLLIYFIVLDNRGISWSFLSSCTYLIHPCIVLIMSRTNIIS